MKRERRKERKEKVGGKAAGREGGEEDACCGEGREEGTKGIGVEGRERKRKRRRKGLEGRALLSSLTQKRFLCSPKLKSNTCITFFLKNLITLFLAFSTFGILDEFDDYLLLHCKLHEVSICVFMYYHSFSTWCVYKNHLLNK